VKKVQKNTPGIGREIDEKHFAVEYGVIKTI
jgi:hypothetical protein